MVMVCLLSSNLDLCEADETRAILPLIQGELSQPLFTVPGPDLKNVPSQNSRFFTIDSPRDEERFPFGATVLVQLTHHWERDLSAAAKQRMITISVTPSEHLSKGHLMRRRYSVPYKQPLTQETLFGNISHYSGVFYRIHVELADGDGRKMQETGIRIFRP